MGDNLYWMITITDRNQSQKFLSFYKTYGIEVVLSTLGKGTAASEILNDFGLEATQKAVLLSVVTGKVWSAVQKGLQTIMLIDIPGTGIAFTMRMSVVLPQPEVPRKTVVEPCSTVREKSSTARVPPG